MLFRSKDHPTQRPGGRHMTRRGIPTPYGGITFRSKTEAKWAFFWDQLSVKWDYEPQGWDTDGEWYLPDFAVFPALGTIWVEIKPTWEADIAGVEKFRRFAAPRTQPSRAVLLIGPPRADAAHLVIGGDWASDDPAKGPWEDDTQTWRPCPDGHHFDLAYPGTFRSKHPEDGCEYVPGNGGEERIAEAADKADRKRFSAKPQPDER